MKRVLLLVPVAVLLIMAMLFSKEELPVGKYRKKAKPEVLSRWLKDYETKRALVPPAPAPAGPVGHGEKEQASADFTGRFRFGNYNYDLVFEQDGNEVTFRSDGVDEQDIGGAWVTVGTGRVVDGRLRARWWCFDVSRNFANNGGAEIWFHKGDKNRIYVQYYHDADEKIEEGYGVRVGTYVGEGQHYRVRIKQDAVRNEKPVTIKGTVRGRDGRRLADAVVMFRHQEGSATRTDRQGRFVLRTRRVPAVVMISAAAPGYRNGVEAILMQKMRTIDFILEPSPYSDDARYKFINPHRNTRKEIWNCGNCHRNSYEEWRDSRHAYAASNPVTKAVYERDFLPALAAGKAEGDPGLCAACHAPEAALDGQQARLNAITGTAAFGNHCDFCHKVHHTEDFERPGVRGSLQLGRPNPDDKSVPGPIKRIYGPLADSDYLFMGPVHNPYFATSALCAGCHQYTTPSGLPALATYREWADWAATQEEHQSCQTCHMPTGTSMERSKLARRIAVNALRRPKAQIHDHSFEGRSLIRASVVVKGLAQREGDTIAVRTTLRPRRVGHKVPTGSSDKHLLLVVIPEGETERVEGPTVPDHAGYSEKEWKERRVDRDFAGFAGREFAQVFADADGRTHVPFWRAKTLVEDTRLVPDQLVTVEHRFRFSGAAPKRVRVELWHRARYKTHDVAADVTGKGVRDPDFLVAELDLVVK